MFQLCCYTLILILINSHLRASPPLLRIQPYKSIFHIQANSKPPRPYMLQAMNCYQTFLLVVASVLQMAGQIPILLHQCVPLQL